jgi:hypothetical protein
MTIERLSTDVLVVGGGTGGVAAAIQAARRGVKTILVSEFAWLGGMLTAAGVCAPDGNELAAWQTGLWGAYLKALRSRETQLSNSWVSLFSYHPRTGAEIFSDWVTQLPNLYWISGQTPLEVTRQGDRISEVRFADCAIAAKIVIDGTELGDLLALSEIPYRWGWEWQSEFNEPSAPVAANELTRRYPVQAPTWVFILQDYGESVAPAIAPSDRCPLPLSNFDGAWANYGAEKFLNYGRLSDRLFMINWPLGGNDYGEKSDRLIALETARKEFLQDAYWHSYNFAYCLQKQLSRRYGLAQNLFPQKSLPSAFALQPYYRESRRIKGLETVSEKDILPVAGGCVAPLPMTKTGEVSAIAIGNYANDHHYPGVEFLLQPKSMRWGGRWTGTPFSIPYGSLVSNYLENFLVCEKNISVSHIANGSTRLQPLVMNIGQAAGMAAALSIELNCQPQELPIRRLQEALLTDSLAPSAIVPLFDLVPENPEWLQWQKYYLEHPEAYPIDGNCSSYEFIFQASNSDFYTGILHTNREQQYSIRLSDSFKKRTWALITTRPEVNFQLQNCREGQSISVWGDFNYSGGWLLVNKLIKN